MTVVAQDNEGASASIEVTIAVTNANEPPSFDPNDNTRSVAENTEPGQAIGDPVAATDPDSGETLTYRLEGTDAAALTSTRPAGSSAPGPRSTTRQVELLGHGGGGGQLRAPAPPSRSRLR